jgi:prepilin-type N-terminal cleavage/methylation domain-containing protein
MKVKKKTEYIIKRKFSGFSLIEMAIVLSILGLLLGGILKGKQLYNAAKLNALVTQIQDIQLSIHQFEQRFGSLPGDFTKASSQIKSGLTDGNGNGIVEETEKDHVWAHLAGASLISSSNSPVAKLGGSISFQYAPQTDLNGHWISITSLTPEQAFAIDKKLDDGIGNTGKVRASQGECLSSDGSYDINNQNPVCTIFVEY